MPIPLVVEVDNVRDFFNHVNGHELHHPTLIVHLEVDDEAGSVERGHLASH
jgi:hypothetical protein